MIKQYFARQADPLVTSDPESELFFNLFEGAYLMMSHSDYKSGKEEGEYATQPQPLSDIEDMEEEIKPKSAMPRRGSKYKSGKVRDTAVSKERNFHCNTCPKTFTTNRSCHDISIFSS